MLPSAIKRAFYAVASPLMRANAARHRLTFARTQDGAGHRAHLGPGQRSYLAGWINVDANMFTGRCDVWADLRYPLPFPDSSLAAVYSHHMVEHLPNLTTHFREVYRCLQPGGVYRVGGPNGDSAVRKFLANDLTWFTHFPDMRRSVGGRLDNFIFCRNEHLAILTFSYLGELLDDAGFEVVGQCMPSKTTNFPALFSSDVLNSEFESDFEHPHTLIVEAKKPAQSNGPA